MSEEREDAKERAARLLAEANNGEIWDEEKRAKLLEAIKKGEKRDLGDELLALLDGRDNPETGGYLGMGLEDPFGVGSLFERIGSGLSSLSRPSSQARGKKSRGNTIV